MGIYVEVNGVQYPASITGKISDKDWDGRASKAITLEIPYSEAITIFTDDIKWNIVQDVEEEIEYVDEETDELIHEVKIKKESYDNSEYSVAGDVIDHRNGSVTVKMGKPTAEEILAMLEEVL